MRFLDKFEAQSQNLVFTYSIYRQRHGYKYAFSDQISGLDLIPMQFCHSVSWEPERDIHNIFTHCTRGGLTIEIVSVTEKQFWNMPILKRICKVNLIHIIIFIPNSESTIWNSFWPSLVAWAPRGYSPINFLTWKNKIMIFNEED